mgnify:CR=1 FL=1
MAIQKTKEPSKVDAALQRFAEMLIKRMEEMQKDWHKGWIGGGSMFGLPQNISMKAAMPSYCSCIQQKMGIKHLCI